MDEKKGTSWLGRFARRGLHPTSPAAFGFALLCVAGATLLRALIEPFAPEAVPFATYFPAILIAALISGTVAGIAAALLSALVSWFLFLTPRFSFEYARPWDLVSLGLFFFAASVVVWVAGEYRSVVRRLDEEEAYRKVVVEELGHRVKNKLATVYAILRHELRGHRDVSDSIAGRLRALSAADDFLVGGDAAGIGLKQILDMELAPYGSASITMRGTSLILQGKLPSVLSLIVHELATNAAKYGALSAPGGGIEIVWMADGDDIMLVWTERGGPAVRPPEKRSFGTNLIERSLDGFRGSAHIDFAPGGIVCRMRFPKSHVALVA